ncbi:probable 3-hydroxyisobutyryl-CoA hydrolase 3 isoform X2 [Zea mays]|uniref:probable 3-hydroxyisobutyryl-CoA hydrolase 3 isoform X2 n=1 Tax=Zea mays TaxID=4577 RepID=UPI0004DEB23D|nr:probable 3-hydroxyisobutyryl-CoA hydrolase 3 isoform X2 [Zea mays]|eukprot:XP_008670923.1 probable 3-hydroxyisobutyryl-CoA hydrolase 3 isoform X2 [Zea mays]
MDAGGAVGGNSEQLLVEAHGNTRTLILNRPKQLNALSYAMIKRLLRCFTAYVKDDGVKLLIIKGSGRAFCAGGDVVACVQSINNDGWKWGDDFFRDQYFLNYIIATCIKPQISLLTGIVMGGGAGVSLHGRFRVATDNTVFAMPETFLGHFPDVGASYFLSRLPGFYGEYVALTGARLDGAEMLACGLATHFVPSNEQVASNMADEWAAETIRYLKRASPTSLKITMRSMREGRTQTIGECLQREYRMVCHVIRGDFSRDLFEGCRAILVDKDKNPKWMPTRLEQVHDEAVEEYFSRIDDPRWEDLNLPVICSHGRIMDSKL